MFSGSPGPVNTLPILIIGVTMLACGGIALVSYGFALPLLVGFLAGLVGGAAVIGGLYLGWPRTWQEAAGWYGRDPAAAAWERKAEGDRRLPFLIIVALVLIGSAEVLLLQALGGITEGLDVMFILGGVGGLSLTLWLLWRWLLREGVRRTMDDGR
jgi:hypothetical protein